MRALTGPEISPVSGNVKRLVIFLHGLGADGNDLISLSSEFADALPDTHFISPNAPFRCDMSPYGYQWFSLLDRDPQRILNEMIIAADPLNAFIDAQRDRFELQDAQVALVGFSQGSMMAMYTSLRRPESLAGIVAYSGLLRGQESLESEITAHPPICLIHGEMDEVVPFAALAMSETALREVGVTVEAHARPNLGHGIDLEGIEIAKRFLRTCFGLN